MEWEPWVTEESVAGGKVRYWPLNRHGGWAGGVKRSTLVCECAACVCERCVVPLNKSVREGNREFLWIDACVCVHKSCLWVFESELFLSGEVTVHPASRPSRSVTWNKIPPNDNIQFQLCQRVLSAPVQSPSKTKGEGAWRGNSSFLLLWHVVTWTPWKTSPVIPAWGPLYSTGRGRGGHDLPDRLCWNMPRCVETDLNKFIG